MKNKKLRLAVIIAAVLVLALAIAYAVSSHRASQELREAYAALEAIDAPMTLEEIAPEKVPDTENAALAYHSVTTALKALPPTSGDGKNAFKDAGELARGFIDGEASTEEKTKLQDLLATDTFKKAFAELTLAAAKPHYWEDLDYSQGAALNMPHLTDRLDLGNLLATAAVFAAETGDSEGAWNHLLTGLRMVAHGDDEPVLISQLARLAMSKPIFAAIQTVAASGPPSVEQTILMDQALAKLDSLAPLKLAMHGERLLLGEWAFNLSKDSLAELAAEESPDAGAIRIYRNFLPIYLRDHAAYLRLMHLYSSNAHKPYDQSDLNVSDRFFETLPRYYVLTRIVAPALDKIKVNFLEAQANVRIARISIALLRAKEESGALPATLADLNLSSETTDPFTGNPLRYQLRDQALTLSSDGQNQREDGDVEDTDDLIWRLPAK